MRTKITVYHLASEKEQQFLPGTGQNVVTPEYAVAYCYAEEHNRLSELFGLVQQGVEGIVERIKERFPLVYGKASVGCGEWASLVRKSA